MTLTEAQKVVALTTLARERGLPPRTLIRAAREPGALPTITIGRRLFTTRGAAEAYFQPRPLTQTP